MPHRDSQENLPVVPLNRSRIRHGASILGSKICEVGLLYTLQLALERVLPKWLCEFGAFYLCELDLKRFVPLDALESRVRRATRDDTAALSALRTIDPRMLQALGDQGHIWLLDDGDRIGAFMWLEPCDQKRFPWLELKIDPGDIFGVDLFVAKDLRGRGIGPRFNSQASVQCTQAGYSRIVSCVDLFNRNSLSADRKLGYRRICRCFVVRVLGFGFARFGRVVRGGRWTARCPLELAVAELRALNQSS